MDKFSYNSYPDSAESSPRSRDVEFENPPPWEDHQQQQQQSYKVKLMCSYGGKIQPRPHDNQLTYVNGDTKIMSVDRGIRFPSLVSKLSAVCNGGGGGGDGGGGGGEISFKYQLPGEDLDALISVTNDEDLEHMMHEYDRLLRMSSKPARMRLFLFPSSPISGGFGSEGSTKSDRDTLNPIPSRPESEKSVSAADFLFGSEKAAPIPPSPVKVPQPVQEPAVIEPPPQMFVDQRMLQPDHGVNPAEIQRQIQEFQRIQIRDQEQQQQQQMLHQNQLHQQQQQQQEAIIHQNQLHQQQEAMHQNHQNQLLQQQQQQEAMYRRKSEDEGGRYFSPTYAQNPAAATTNPQPPIGYWQGNNNIPGNVYATTTSQNLPEQQQQVYMIPAQSQAPGTIYQSVMRPPTVQGNQGYYPPVQRMHPHPDAYMEQQNQSGYNVVQPQPPYSGGPQVMTSVGPQVMTSVGPTMGLQEPYSQMGKPVYYTVAGDGMMVQPPPPQPQQQQQYQGVGQPVSGMTDLRTGPDGKVVNMAAPKVTDSV
ncbi:PREDICTED: alpha-protein kinase 1-like [Camelina sativa]|uniref:Alpha-protein kinase 1-like n=1 Tax=Camelina sativa TaxID=90675 RepID=A0ABM0T9N2_CAMSA|nr:PREDICTED: alpha-protein kinase 1-like [Camelina sativa]